jgi:hypothetical protein
MSGSDVRESAPAMQYLNLIGQRIAAMREDLGRLADLGERMARPLLAGGGLFAPRIGTYWPSEFGGRAGGLMGLKPSDYLAQSSNDVAFTTLPDARRWKPADDAAFAKLLASPAQIFIIGREQDLNAAAPASRIAGFTGGAGAEEGLYGHDSNRPLAPLRPFEQFVRGWVTAGEMIAAMTRAGRMPIIWMSVWLEGAFVRNATFIRHHNLREPWSAPLFHDEIYVPPLDSGYVARTFLAELEKLHTRLIAQAPQLATAGRWMAQAKRAGKRLSTVAVGHSYPAVLEIREPKDYPLEWLPSISDLRHAHPQELGPGDVALHLGYSPVDAADVQKILDRGVRFIYSSPYGRPAKLTDHPNLLWLDLPWRPADATVDVPGYSVRICPMSSSAHTMAYFAMVSELAEHMGWA